MKLISDVSWMYIQSFAFFRKNLLPSGGTYTRESQKYIDAMFTIDREVDEIEKAELKGAKK